MARAILVIGEPGTGKSRAIKGLDPKKTVIIKPNSKELPFRGAAKSYIVGKNMFVVQTFAAVGKLLDEINKAKHIKNVVIEDLTHYFSKRVIDQRTTKGFEKWETLAADTKTHIIDKESSLRPDLNIIVIAHVTSVQDAAGNVTVNIQTPGKLLDNLVKIPSYFLYIFHTFLALDPLGNIQYQFLTNKDGIREAKSPEEMFPKYIDNDYQLIIDGIVKYQNEEGLTPIGTPLVEERKEEPKPEAEPTAETPTEQAK